MRNNPKKNKVILDLITDGDKNSTLRKSITLNQAQKMAEKAYIEVGKEVKHGR